MCKDCFISYCKNALTSRSFKEHHNYGYTLQCPGIQLVCLSLSHVTHVAHCEDSYISEIHHFRLMTAEEVLYCVVGVVNVLPRLPV